MKYCFYIVVFMLIVQPKVFSKDADLFNKEFDHIYLLESVANDADDAKYKYKYKIIKKFKYTDIKNDIADDRVNKLRFYARRNKRVLFAYKIQPEMIWWCELDDSGDFTFEIKERNQKAGKKLKLNISDLILK